jgi:hypothetical protein
VRGSSALWWCVTPAIRVDGTPLAKTGA